MRRSGRLLMVATFVVASACSNNDSGARSGDGRTVAVPTTEPPATDAVDTVPDAVPDTTLPAIPEPDLELDPAVVTTTLDNGLRVFVRENDRPGAQAEMRLVIDAGSALEEPDQSGAAHFLEHMLFNGTERYPANELIDVLQGFGMEFGADVNAYTSYDETVYELSVPNDPDQLATGVDVLAEWLSAATIDPDQVVAERGVVLDEWRGSAGSAGGRTFAAIAEMFFGGTAYEGRDPIGTEAAIQAMTSDTLRRYYDRWYRPDNAAIVIVGDVDAGEMMTLVSERLGGIAPRSDEPLDRPDLRSAPVSAPEAKRHLEPENREATIELTLPNASTVETLDGWQASLTRAVAFDVIALRLDDDIRRGALAATVSQVDSNSHARGIDAPSVLLRSEPADARNALAALVTEFERVQRFGFNPGEVQRSVDSFISSATDQYEGRNTVQDAEFAETLVDHALTGALVPDADTDFAITIEILGGITPQSLATEFEAWSEMSAPHLLLLGPSANEAEIPTEDEAIAAVGAAADLTLEPRPDESFSLDRLMTPPAAVAETGRESLAVRGPFLDAEILSFANGARVLLNVTDIADEAVAFGATSAGGLSVVDDANVANAQLMTQVARASGIAEFDSVAFESFMSQNSVDFNVYVDQIDEGFYGSSTTPDLETVFQLLNLSFTQPRFDDAGFSLVMDQWRPFVEQPNAEPDLAGTLALDDARYGGEPRWRSVPTPENFAAISLQGMRDEWSRRFSSAGDFTFALSGDFDPEVAAELARQYIGSLPGTPNGEAWTDTQPDPPAGVVVTDVIAGTGAQGSLTTQYTGPVVDVSTDSILADLVTIALGSRLTDHIREELGASYSPSAFMAATDSPDAIVTTWIQVTGDPTQIETLAAVVQDDIAALRAQGIGQAAFDEALAALTREYDLYNNETLIAEMLGGIDDLDSLSAWAVRYERLAEVTLEQVDEFVRRALPDGQRIEIRVRPG